MNELKLSLIQNGMWKEQFAWPENTHLNLGGYSLIEGKLDFEVMQNALNILVEQNSALRLIPTERESQILLEKVTFPIHIKDFRHEQDPKQKAKKWQREWMSVPFKSSELPPNRFAILRVSDDSQYLVVQCLHTVIDGWSVSLIVKKWSEIYNRLVGKADENRVAKSYLEFIEESRAYKESKAYEKDHLFWEDFLPNLPTPIFNKKYDTNSEIALARSHIYHSSLNREFLIVLEDFSKQYNVSVFHCLLALLACYLCKSQNQNEVVIGVPNLNRGGNKYKATLGMFVNVLPILIECKPDSTLIEIIKDVKGKLSLTYRHAKYPFSAHFERLKALLNGRDILFDVLLSYESFDFVSYFGEAVATATQQTLSGKTRYPLAMTVTDFDKAQDGEMILEGSEEYFSSHEMSLISRRITYVGEQLLVNEKLKINHISITPDYEKQSQLDLITTQTETLDSNYFKVIYEQGLLFPDYQALLWADKIMTHRELNKSVHGLYYLLIENGVNQGDVVAFRLERSPLVIVAMLAINKLGATFLPIDAQAPSTRVEFILSDAKAFTLLQQSDSVIEFENFKGTNLLIELEELRAPNLIFKDCIIKDSDIAYILYTSGSTGKPKGVKVSHRALLSRLQWISEHWEVTHKDVSLQATQHHFDPALIECFVTLIKGGAVAFPPPGTLLPESLPELIKKYSATLMAFVPSTLSRFLDGCVKYDEMSLRVCCCGGEVLPKKLVDRFERETNAHLFNVYGPTETTIFATSWSTKRDSAHFKSIPIGQPLSGTAVYVLDGNKKLQPFGVVGELYIAGNSVADSYVDIVLEDQNRFQKDVILGHGKMFQTGDLGWLDVDGIVHFVGRRDRQIKLRGYRIELDEVEIALKSIGGVSEAAAKVIETGGQSQIHAWVTGNKLTNQSLRTTLANMLPNYMLPQQIHILSAFPYTSNEKIDYQALNSAIKPASALDSREAIGKFEVQVLRCWRKVLKNKNVSVNDNFFEAGGDSLSAVITVTELERIFDHSLSLHHLISNPTVASLAACIEQELNLPKVLVSLGSTSRGASLYIAASGNNDVIRFQALAEEMKGYCDLHMLQPPGNDVGISIKELGALYAENIAQKSNDKIYIAGFSIGGLAALETAKILQSQNKTVEHLFIVDTILISPPAIVMLLWNKLSQLENNLGSFAKFFFPKYIRTLLNDRGLYTQVRGMRGYKLVNTGLPVSLLKSTSFSWLQPYLVKKWRKVFNHQLQEYKIETTHSGFFEQGKVTKLASILKQKISKPKP